MTKTTKMPERKRIVCSAILAISNLGMPRPSAHDVARVLKRFDEPKRYSHTPRSIVESAVTSLGQQYMESDEHQRMFTAEAMSFYKDKTLAHSLATCWKDIDAIYEAASQI